MTDTVKLSAEANDLLATAVSDKELRTAPDGTPFMVLHGNMRLNTLESLLPEPVRIEASRDFTYPAAFSAYVKEFSLENTRLFAKRERGSKADHVEAVIDYHKSDGAKASWAKHGATLSLRKGVDWLKWIEMDGKAFSHAGLIDFLTDFRNELIKFTAVDEKTGQLEERQVQANIVLDMLRKMKVKRTADQDSTVGSGEFAMMVSKEERVLADGKPWPAILTVALPVYDGMARWELNFRLTVLEEGRGIRITLIRPELVEQAAFDQACGAIIDATGCVIYGYRGNQTVEPTTPAPTTDDKPKRNRNKKADAEPAAEEAAAQEQTEAVAEAAPEAPAAEAAPAPVGVPTEPAPLPEPVAAPQAESEAPAAPAPAPWAKPQA